MDCGTSRVILNWALTVCVLVLTFFIAWILTYMVRIFRDIRRTVKQVTSVVDKFNQVLDDVREKMSNLAALIPLAVEGAKRLAEFVGKVREKRSEKARSKRKRESRNLD